MFTSPSFSLSSSVFQCTEGNQKGDAFAPKTSTWASPLSSTTTFGAPSFAGFGSSMSALGFSSVHPFGSSQSTSVQGPHATSSISNFKQSHCGGQERGSIIENYKRTPAEIEFGEYVSISAMPVYKDKSHEELRWEDYKFTTKGPHAPRSTVNFKQSHCGGEERGSRIEKYKRTPAEIEFGEYVSISAMPVYKDKSHEELRWDDYKFTTKEKYGAFAQTSSPFSSGPGFGSSTSPIGFSSPTMVEGSHSSSNICGCPQVLGHGYQKEDAFAPKTSFIETLYGSPTTSNYGGIPTRAFVQTSSPLVEGPHASRSTVNFEQSHCGGEERGSRIENYKRTPAEIEFGEYVSISAMPIYKDKSHEELRWEDYKFTTKGSHSSSGIYGCPEVLGQGYHKGDPFAPKTSSTETVYGSPTPLVEGPHASRSTVNFKQSHCGGERGSRIENYKRTPAKIEFGEYVSISAMPVYKDKSHEELRWEDYQFTPKGGFGSSSSANPCSITAIANLNKFNPFVPKTTLPSLPTHTSSSSPSFEKCTGTPLPPKSHLSLEGSPSIQYGISNIPVKEITVAAFVPRELAITGTMHEEKLPGSVYENDKDDPTEEKNLLPTILDAPSKLQLPDYYTIPHISELESKERAEPGFCSHVKEFVIGRHGHGSIKFLGETDVRNLDLETFVQFNNRELIVYMDETKKPPVGQGLNKPAEITLLNIKCIDKRSRVRYEEGPMIDKYREMLKKKVAAQGGEFISYHPVEGEWKFRVQHF